MCFLYDKTKTLHLSIVSRSEAALWITIMVYISSSTKYGFINFQDFLISVLPMFYLENHSDWSVISQIFDS